MEEKKTVRFGIVGMGAMGVNHANKLKAGEVPQLELAAVCDADEARLANYEEFARFTDPKEMIESPHFAHTTVGIQALDAGLHVIVEKPVSVHIADCDQLLAAHRDTNQVFAAMLNQRTDPHYVKLRKLIQSGELGEVRRVNWIITDWYRTQSYYDGAGWKATWKGEGGAVLMNQCPHQLDLLCWLFGKPERVRAFCQYGKFHDIETEDSATAYMEFPNGATGVFITTTGEAPGTNRLEIAADRGKVVIETGVSGIRWTRTETSVQEHINNEPGGFTRPGVWNIDIPVKGKGEQHVGILKNFADAILKGEDLIAPASEGRDAVELCNARLYSSFTDQTVELPLDGEAYVAELQRKIDESTFEKKVNKNAASSADFENSFGGA